MVKLQCSISAQDCPTLFSPTTSLIKLPYGSGSCVRDNRLAGNVGRCGFPGAACVTDSLGNDNCAYGGDSTVPNYTPLCQNGFCGGGLGAKCTNGNYDCNWGYYCNTTASSSLIGVCGGRGAFVDSQGDVGVDFAFDYCLSGKATQSTTGSWYCDGEVAGSTAITSISSVITSRSISSSSSSSSTIATRSTTATQPTITMITSTRIISIAPGVFSTIVSTDNSNLPDSAQSGKSKHSSTGLIAGVVSGVVVVIILLSIIFILWRRSRNIRPAPSPQIIHTDPFTTYTTEPLLGVTSTSPANSQMQQITPSTTPGSYPTPAFSYLPEIQHDQHTGASQYPAGNFPGPGGYAPTALATTPTSPAFAYASSTGSSPPISPSPYANSFGNPVPHSVPPNSTQYASSTRLDATERHLLAARMEADRELAQMRRDGRDS